MYHESPAVVQAFRKKALGMVTNISWDGLVKGGLRGLGRDTYHCRIILAVSGKIFSVLIMKAKIAF